MTEHLSTLQIKQLSVSALPETELAAAALHTTECQSCNRRFVEELRRHRGSASFSFTLEPAFWFRDDHVDFDLLEALTDKSLDQETEEIVNIHLQTCETCSEDVRSFLAFRETTAGEIETSHARPEIKPAPEVGTAPWWQRLPMRPVYAVAAIVLVVVAVLIGVIAFNQRSGSLEANKQDQPTPGTERSPNVSPSPAQTVRSSPSNVEDSETVATLKDGGGEVTIDKRGRVTGLDEVSENSRQYIARVALSDRIEPADVLRRLSGEQSGLRSNGDGPKGFRLLSPLRHVVIEDRPVFRWERLPGASSYQVYVLDENGNEVSQSEGLAGSTTQWKASAPLPRGQIFSWVVTALIDGKKVVSPSASEPEMKFAVLSTEDFRELTRLKQINSHLALGVFYARTGLLNEAEREFENLVKLNPQSELPHRLLQNVRSIRKETN